MPYTLHLHLLECLRSQEDDGDEIYLRLNGETIFSWDVTGKTFHHDINRRHTDAFDFRTCKIRTPDGWARVEAHHPEDFVFTYLEGPVTFALWESDRGNPLRGADDHFGDVVLDPLADGVGEREVLFEAQGATYRLVARFTQDG